MHTPAPWIATDEVERFYEGNIVRAGDLKGSIVAIACDFNRFDRDAERVANSRLIAAAPDLLEALQAAVNDMKEMTYSVVTFSAARAAIARATGEASS